MGLDIYAGTLTRYYSGQWETILQQTAKETGQDVMVIRLNEDPDDEVCSPEEVQEVVTEWRTMIGRAIKSHLTEPLEWPEGMDLPYFTDKPDWDGLNAVQLLASYATLGRTDYPKKLPKNLEKHPVYIEVMNNAIDSPMYQLLQAEIWLPTRFNFVFQNECLGEQNRLIGSLPTLLEQLNELNEATLQSTEGERESWRKRGPSDSNDFLETAQFGLAIWMQLAEVAAKNHLSMILDY
jgi:hypothetical protein